MRLNEFYKIADELAPKALSDEICKNLGWFDNSGILVDTGEEIKGVLFSLDFSLAAIDKAIETGADLIVTHHPGMYGKFNRILNSDFQPLGKKLVKCLRHGISVISMHLNLDLAADGTDESLMEGILLSAGETAGAGMRSQNVPTMHTVTGGGYGRVYNVPKIALGALKESMKNTFSTSRVETYGNEEKAIGRVASFCGGGGDEDAVEFAVKHGADLIVSSDFKHHVLSLALESGLCVLSLTHYASENYGFKNYYEKIRRRVEIPCGYHTDESLL